MVARVEEKRRQLEAYEALCREIGHPPGEVALAWLLHNPAVSAPIIGPRTMEQLESAARATEIKPGWRRRSLDRLDKIFPGPGWRSAKGIRLVSCPADVQAKPRLPAWLIAWYGVTRAISIRSSFLN